MKFNGSLLAFLAVTLLFGSRTILAQSSNAPRQLSLEAVYQRIQDHHPVALQAALLERQAEAKLRAARGAFDPKAYAEWQQKSFKGTEYYTFSESGLKIPTWYGLELKGSYKTARGTYVNPENGLPAVGQAVVGVKASALRGLFIDERRATLQQAKLMQARNEAEQKILLNELKWESARAYWEWWAAYQQWQVYQRALENARERQFAIVESFIQGDKPAIDTLESFVQVQNRTLEVQQAELDFRKAGLQLANYLWEEGEIPLELDMTTLPDTLFRVNEQLPFELAEILPNLQDIHPELRQYQIKISELEIDRRLAAEQLKPRLDLEYNFLGNGFDLNYQSSNDAAISNLITENYKIGLSFEMPLFLRKERGKLAQADLKLLDAGYGLQQKRLSINNKILSYFAEWETTRDQLNLYQQTVANYQRLLDAELRKFSIGESSIFLINSRENKLIDAELKLIKLQATLPKLEAGVQWAAGRLVI
ncbi:TolC family protein [Flavilitoribacter nigricans]|uniref:Transporter n=1 Tax=Flavilitoribacter nigricans (strain ATCC 23147 / DSM 23189 / NBRC 102662 / NCIMB 1420 / SS-2) TaxID=1122177 RepID=A0A2D0N428_FLAN2|nr:TolC family protein [Flavilitoribacter nigricans]PHN03150.1 transporter [Flavilitoribacter nigricans DSM 23189 = NBRC 102662]